jgi:nucleoside-diphosphate-sugar epimerase
MSRYQLFAQPSFIPIFENFNCFKGRKIGITGHRGVLGKILNERLSLNGVKVISYSGDITDITDLAEWFSEHQFDYFFHFAAIVPIDKTENQALRAYEVNAIGCFNICKQIIKTQTNCWLFLASSSHVYQPTEVGDRKLSLNESAPNIPSSFYGASKLAGERIVLPLLEHEKLPFCIGRIFSFSHISQKEPYLVPSLKRKILETPIDGLLEVVNAESVRDIMDAETVVDCLLHLAQNSCQGIINIGTGEGLSVGKIALDLARDMRKKIRIKKKDMGKINSIVADVQKMSNLFACQSS